MLNYKIRKILLDISYYKSRKKKRLREKSSHYRSKKPAENAKSFDRL